MNPPAGWHPDPYDPSIDRYWDGQQWTNQTRPRGSGDPTQVFGAVGQGGNPPAAGGSKRRKWPWALGAGLVGLVALGAAVGDEEPKTETSSVVSTTSSSVAPTTTTSAAPTTTTSTSVVPSTVSSPVETTVSDVPTTEAAPATTTTLSLEYSCSDAAWREMMGSEGYALCGAPWTPRNQPQTPAYTPPPTSEYTPPPATQYTPPPAPAYTPPSQDQQSSGTVHPGSYCSSPGALGATVKGTPMVCGVGSDGEYRWKSAG